MTNVSEWSTSAGSNNGAPPAGAPEGMLPGKVNDVLRENMAACARWYQDSDGTLVTTGSANAYILTTNSSYAALNDIPLLVFRASFANTGAATLAVDGLTAKSLKAVGGVNALVSGAIAINQLVVAAYNSVLDIFEGINLGTSVDVGTRSIFQQTAAPTGYTKDTSSHNNKAIRLVTGTASSGGSTAFTSVFASRTISFANLPSGNLSHSLTASSHSHGSVVTGVSGTDNIADTGSGTTTVSGLTVGNTGASGSISVAGTVSLGGSDSAMDFAVQYADAIIATKA